MGPDGRAGIGGVQSRDNLRGELLQDRQRELENVALQAGYADYAGPETAYQRLMREGVPRSQTSRLYDHESTTYAAAFGPFYNLKRENLVIVTRMSGLPDAAELQQRSLAYDAPLKSFGVDRLAVLALFSTERDWDASARVLTDQYSPANLLNR